VERALALVEAGREGEPAGAAASDDAARDDLARLPLGTRDALLLELRERTLGAEMGAWVFCPCCGVTIDFTIDVEDVRGPAPAGPLVDRLAAADGWEVELRLADSDDLAVASRAATVEEARGRLVERCVVAAWHDGEPVAAAELPEEALAAVAARMEELDPQAERPLALHCPHCGERWLALFDVASFFWEEVRAQAQRLLYDIHVLARYYGWSEREVLALTPLRRQFYLEQASPQQPQQA
jgi:hypothetical protein